MKKQVFNLFALAALLFMPFTFAACGGSDDEEEVVPPTDPVAGLPLLLQAEDGLYHNNVLLFRITDAEKHEVEVVNPVNFGTCRNAEIPEAVNINEERYAVTTIADNAFSIFDNETGKYVENNVLETIIIPHSINKIGQFVCSMCYNLKDVFIPKEVEQIGWCFLFDCPALEEIIVQEGNAKFDSRQNCNALIKTINNCLLKGCKNTVIPNGIKIIDVCAFENIPELTEIDIPASVTSIEQRAFADCTNLMKITSRNTTPPTLDKLVFHRIPQNCMLYVPDRCVDKYLSQWPFKSGYVKAFGISVDR
ncbi:MAG: leucine-rich repeat domain-containing protein [Bacteroidaceae bacterium]|nr:leucine-rich repeat domain-containing protein [Bacteroidaceae bacterium]